MSHLSPNWPTGYEPTAAEWSIELASKQDWDAALDAVIASGGLLPLSGGTMTGPIQFGASRVWSGGSLNTNPYLSQITGWTGTNNTAGGTSFNYLQATDSVNAGTGPGNGAALMDIQLISQGVSKIGQSNALNVSMKLNTTSGNTIASGNSGIYTAGRFTAYTTANDNGTGGTPWGGILGLNAVGALYAGATNYDGVSAMEFDVLVQAGASARDKIGLSVVLLATDAVNGTRDDIGLTFNNQYAQGGGVGWLTGISFGRLGGAFPIAATGTMIGAVSGNGTLLAAHGIDFSAVTFSSDFLKSVGFSVNGSGNVSANAIVATTYISRSVGNALTAAGTNRATALALTHQINNVTTAAASTGVLLPAVSVAGIGTVITIYNGGASATQVYGAGSDTIDTIAGVTGVPLTNAKRCTYTAVAAATWVSAQLGVVSA